MQRLWISIVVFLFNGEGWGAAASDYSNQDYRGNLPASEPETQAIINYALSIFPTLQRQTDVTNAHANPNTNF
jgi:hypothetical protein